MHNSNHRVRLFTYGTLTLPEIMSRVVGQPVLAGSAATLQHYRCNLVSGQSFPGVTPSRGATATGILYENFCQADLQRLDNYEGPLYKRDKVKVSQHHGEEIEAWCYIIRTVHRSKLSATPWNLRHFKQNHLDNFLYN
ncbi:MAG: gamma-glutamylcyclotransferase family protein [Amphritea sp.]